VTTQLRREAAPLRTQAVAALRRRIVEGGFRPGDRLVEKRLEEELGVSRTVVREALRQLETEQLVYLKPHVGPVVRVLTAEDAKHLYQVRAALEGAAARLAAEGASAEQGIRLRAILDRFSRLEDGAVQELVALKDEFYEVLVEAAGNPVIAQMLGNIQARIALLRSYTLQTPGRVAQSHEELSAVVDAIEAHEPDRAEALSRYHVLSAQRIALDHFIDAEPGAGAVSEAGAESGAGVTPGGGR
jgi:GntR family transcriptional regulator, trigonelline degradation regulator